MQVWAQISTWPECLEQEKKCYGTSRIQCGWSDWARYQIIRYINSDTPIEYQILWGWISASWNILDISAMQLSFPPFWFRRFQGVIFKSLYFCLQYPSVFLETFIFFFKTVSFLFPACALGDSTPRPLAAEEEQLECRRRRVNAPLSKLSDELLHKQRYHVELSDTNKILIAEFVFVTSSYPWYSLICW